MMRNVLLALALGMSISGFAQILNVGSITKVNVPENQATKVAAVSAQGNYVLLTTDINKGLTRFDLSTGEATVLSDALGAGYDVKVSQDGQNVVYREKSFTKNHLSQTALQSRDLLSGEVKTLVKPTRNLEGVSMDGNTVTMVNNGKKSVKAVAGKAQKQEATLSIKNRDLMITRDGKTTVFSPNGAAANYLWPSVSPDGTKALYYVVSKGAFVCNIDGTNVTRLGNFRAPKWMGNDVVIGMHDQDNGEVVTSSEIVAANLNGQIQTLTDDSVIAMYPQVSENVIAFSTPEGEVYIINVNK